MRNFLRIVFFVTIFLGLSYSIQSQEKMKELEPIFRYDNLNFNDGEKICVVGLFKKRNPMGDRKMVNPFYLSRIVLEGNEKDFLFLENNAKNKEKQDFYHNKKVKVTGTFYNQQPVPDYDLGEAEPARFIGRWIYDVDTIIVID